MFKYHFKQVKLLFVFLLVLFNVSNVFAQNSSYLYVRVVGIEEIKGRIYVALFNQAKGFPNADNAIRNTIIEVKSNIETVRFDKLESGEYAVAVFQDLNNNEKLDFNWIGMPSEPAAFSIRNNAFLPPSYKASAFMFEGKDKIMEIKIK